MPTVDRRPRDLSRRAFLRSGARGLGGTWLSCEETPFGEVYECDPYTPGSQGVVRPALGRFNHEAAAVDPVHQEIYRTEDQGDGLLYRFTPSAYPHRALGKIPPIARFRAARQ